jgi:iron(III) transport system ATP-binding protein
MSFLRVEDLTKTYPRAARPAVDGVGFELEKGKVLALVGESGSGKTTLLRLLGGLETPDRGRIELDGREISSASGTIEPERRGIGLVFQHGALFPHLTVARNLVFGIRGSGKAERERTVAELLDLVGLPGVEKRYPHELSGGERQRIALARALAPRPRLMLFDEPFSSLDTLLRHRVRDETRAILKRRGTTAVVVTHDTGDALAIADRLVVLRDGVVQQTGAPPEVYHAPANSYVASFFGTCNFLPFHSLPHPSGARILCHVGPPGVANPDRGGLWVRPEDLELARPDDGNREALAGEVRQVDFGGAHLDVRLACEMDGAKPFEVTVRHHAPFMVNPGETWAILPKPRRR